MAVASENAVASRMRVSSSRRTGHPSGNLSERSNNDLGRTAETCNARQIIAEPDIRITHIISIRPAQPPPLSDAARCLLVGVYEGQVTRADTSTAHT